MTRPSLTHRPLHDINLRPSRRGSHPRSLAHRHAMAIHPGGRGWRAAIATVAALGALATSATLYLAVLLALFVIPLLQGGGGAR